MRTLREAVNQAYFVLCPPLRRLRDHCDALRADRDALRTEIQHLEEIAANAKIVIPQRPGRDQGNLER